MLLFYILLIVYVLAVNFYSFLYVFALHKVETQPVPFEHSEQEVCATATDENLSVASVNSDKETTQPDEAIRAHTRKKTQKPKKPSLVKAFAVKPVKGFNWRLVLCAALGGALTIYICMFVFRYKLNDLFLMLVTPILAAANGYLWFILLSSRFFMRA